MSQHSTVLSPTKPGPQVRAGVFHYEDGEDTSSLQCLINILSKPQEHACPSCLGQGIYLTGAHCEHCLGSGKRPRSRSSC
jgi:hypothetical protein